MKRPPKTNKPPRRTADSRSRKRALPRYAGDRDSKSSKNSQRPRQKSVPAAASPTVSQVGSGRSSRAGKPKADKPDIGFKSPPKKHSWKKGQSGNPKGRKKGSRNKKSIIISLMEGRLGRKIPDPRKLTAQEAMLWKAIQKGLAGDAKAMAFAFKRYDDATANSWEGPVITTEEDQQVYDALRAKIRREIEEE